MTIERIVSCEFSDTTELYGLQGCHAQIFCFDIICNNRKVQIQSSGSNKSYFYFTLTYLYLLSRDLIND